MTATAGSVAGASDGAPTRVRVRVERLVVDGAPGVPADLLAGAVADELRRLASRGAPPAPVAAELPVDPVGDPVGAGRAIAAALHARLLAEVADG
ncbi:hypothetical protein [Frankia nepalensis]|uniref:Uncharacterized protein n=1 Tax=Frankia nepalensis TaxID=1836974 RepID=A0A937US95_9ACTN|nr:hypothetical protein [Frankia nepalensis]MBL7501511.1 hypothetical protein [Frankia nepalensis]MBL7516445.1 hypothetical protein [Frankia nepalensis]MBL7633629.1 hypothetical protein [Frankia nepalensis]